MLFTKQIVAYEPQNEQEIGDKRVILDYIETFPDNILLRSNVFAHLTSSGFIMNENLDKILMIHHNIYNTWAWTGGHADGDTDLLYIALKEATEETGVVNVRALDGKINSIDILPVWGHMKNGRYVSAHLHLNASYILIADENDALCINEDETTGVKWVPIDKITEYSNEPDIIAVYHKLIQRAQIIKK
ncbi:MAG: NUDIX hydrolase [Cellulosilyticaceae bacterium]